MHRLVGALMVVCVACLVAGCGGSSLKKAALDDASQFTVGTPHPTSVRTEYVQNVGGMREAVLFLQGHFRLHRDCQIPQARCPKGSTRASVIVIDLGLPDPKASWGFATESSAQAAALAAAKNASSLFKIFADFTNPAIRCTITSGGPARRKFAGACVTFYKRADHVTQVEFRERWPFHRTRDGHWPRNEKTGGWIVTLGSGGQVESIRQIGSLPPQLWR